MLSNSVCNHTRLTNRTPASPSSDFVNHSYDYRLNWTPLSPISIIRTSRHRVSRFLIKSVLQPTVCSEKLLFRVDVRTEEKSRAINICEIVSPTFSKVQPVQSNLKQLETPRFLPLLQYSNLVSSSVTTSVTSAFYCSVASASL